MKLILLLIVTASWAFPSSVQVTAFSGNGQGFDGKTCSDSGLNSVGCQVSGEYGSVDVQASLFSGTDNGGQQRIGFGVLGHTSTKANSYIGAYFSSSAVIDIPTNWGNVQLSSGPVYAHYDIYSSASFQYDGQVVSPRCLYYAKDLYGDGYTYYSCTLAHSFGQENQVTVTFVASDDGGAPIGQTPVFKNFGLGLAPVPEPGTLAFISLPVVLLGGRFFRLRGLRLRAAHDH